MRTYILAVLALFLTVASKASAGQALVAPAEFFVENSSLVVVVKVKSVKPVEVPTVGDGGSRIIYVAEAEVLQTLKGGAFPIAEGEEGASGKSIAIAGSVIPRSSAVWQPIDPTRYLAFLSPVQGHFTYKYRYAMRKISDDDKVKWMEKNAKGEIEIYDIDLEDAVRTIKEIVAAKAEKTK